MRKNLNTVNIEGYVYEFKLEEKTVQNTTSKNYGKPFINGTLSVAVDEEGLNVLTINYTYVTPTYNSGKANSTYTNLKKIMTEGKTWLTDGKENATKVKCTPSIGLNDWWSERDGQYVSTVRNSDGFVNIVNSINADEKSRNTFTVDMVITNTIYVEENEEKGTKPHMDVKGAIFDFRNAVLPITFKVNDPEGINFFEKAEISPSEPMYTKCNGRIFNSTIVEKITEESGFGGPMVREITKREKSYIITQVSSIPYDFGDENVLTVEDLQKANQEREVYLATVKKNAEEYAAQKNAANSGFTGFGGGIVQNGAAPAFGNGSKPLF